MTDRHGDPHPDGLPEDFPDTSPDSAPAAQDDAARTDVEQISSARTEAIDEAGAVEPADEPSAMSHPDGAGPAIDPRVSGS